MIKILLITTNFYPNSGGLEKYCLELFTRINDKENYQVNILCLDNKLERTTTYAGLKITRIRYILRLKGVFAIPHPIDWWKYINNDFKKGGYQFISTQTHFFFTSYLGAKLAKKYNIPLIHTEHGSGYIRNQSRLISYFGKAYQLTFGRYVLSQAAAVTAVSKGSAKFVAELSGREAVVIYNCIDLAFWDSLETTKKTKPNHIKNNIIPLIFIGRIIEAKGWGLLLQSIQKLPEDMRKKIHLYIAGDGPDKNKLKSLLTHPELKNIVSYLGLQDPTELRYYLSFCAYINPSFSAEGLQTTLLEAMAMNAYIISTDVSGADEIIINNEIGTIIPQNNIKALTKSLEILINRNSTRSSFNRTILEVKFSWDQAAKAYEEILETL